VILPHRALAIAAAAAVAVACGGRRQPAGDANPVVTGPGRLVAIGGGRSLYLNCTGSGSPTVVLEAGFGGDSTNWSAVQPPLSRTTRTCSYDRAGLGSSLPMPGVHDAADEIADLQRLLTAAHIPPPYVLVGHSYGGLLVRLFAHAHARETAGVVLVDAMGHDQDRRARQVPHAPTLPPVQAGVNLRAGERLDAQVRTLGDTPLVVITHGHGDPTLPARVRGPIERLWMRMQDELAAMSSDRLHVVATRSGHFVQGYADGQPAVVVRAVRAVVDAARRRAPLPACRALFAGPRVACRT
jgi:pimeloyl-ACP methyl ester carboxylesterase